VKDMKDYDSSHFLTNGLPCAHIFVARTQAGKPIFSRDMVPAQWRKSTYLKSIERQSAAEAGEVVSASAIPSSRVQTAQGKFRKASINTDALAQLLASVGANECNEKLRKLQLIYLYGRMVAMLLQKKLA